MPKDVILTPEGLEKLKEELEHLSTDKRREVAERIKEAREFGDISENSEYDDAKNEQAMLEARIAQLEEKLRSRHGDRRAKDVAPTSCASARSSTSRTRRPASRTKYTIVGSAEAEPARAQALQRVAGRQGAARPQAQRHGHRRGPARAEEEAQDHQDRDRLAACRLALA